MNLEADFSILFDQKRYSEIIDKALENGITPRSYPLLSKYLAAAYFSIGEFTLAEEILIDLESSFQDDPNFLSLFAATSRRLLNFERAERLFDQALRLNPESLQVRNNFANLLIDLARYDQARSMLEQVLKIDPSYSDAQDNLNRLMVLSGESNNVSGLSKNVQTLPDLEFQDPLLFAFQNSEVEHSTKRYKMFNYEPFNDQSGLSNLPDAKSSDVALEQLAAARDALGKNNYSLVLKLCSQAYRVLGTNSQIYDLISDAYLNLERYLEAEMFLLHSVSLDGPSLKRYFNLVSFSLMRSDFAMAHHYLRLAHEIDSSSSDLQRLSIMVAEKSANQKDFVYDFCQITPVNR